jgi:hypothetical protein
VIAHRKDLSLVQEEEDILGKGQIQDQGKKLNWEKKL